MSDFERQEVTVLELDLDSCANRYGVAPCTAGRKDSGIAQAGAASTITLAATASAVDDTYNTMVVRLTAGTGAGQERVIGAYAGATRVATVTRVWAPAPDATSTYDVIDRPNACYNTFPHCQDKPNFVKTVKTWRFVTPGARPPAGDSYRPYILNVASAPTEIDLERGLAPRAKVTVTVADPPDTDVEADPYTATRPEAAGGTFWPRLLARDPNYVGRFARLRTAHFTDGWDDAKFTTELYVIERIDPPDSGGRVKITLKDPFKLADRRTYPVATNAKLASALAVDGLAAQLEPGQGASLPAAGHIRLGDEIIEYTGNAADILTWPDVTYRGRFNTVAAEAKVGNAVQETVTWTNARIGTVLEDLLLAAGFAPGNIDSAGISAQDDQWLGGAFLITAQLSEPERISALLAELAIQTGGYMWWDPVAQQARFRVIAPLSPGAGAVMTLTEEANILEGSVRIERRDELRLTRVVMFYAPVSGTSDRSKRSKYLRGEGHVDLDDEGPNALNEIRADVRYSRWYGVDNAIAVKATVSRRTARYRLAPQIIHVSLDVKDEEMELSDLVDVTLAQVVGLTGKPETVRALVTYRKNSPGRINLRLRATSLGKRYFFFAPAGAGVYPADSGYFHFAPDANGFSDGTEPYVFF